MWRQLQVTSMSMKLLTEVGTVFRRNKKEKNQFLRTLTFSMHVLYGRVYSRLSLLAHFSLFRWDSPSPMSEEACKWCLCGSRIKENKWRHQIYIWDETFVHDHRQCNQGEDHEVLSWITTGSLTLGACICCILCALLFLSSIFIFFIVSSCIPAEPWIISNFQNHLIKTVFVGVCSLVPRLLPSFFHIL